MNASPQSCCFRSPAWIAIGLVIVLTLCWPGDTFWINDEPQLLGNAFEANENGTLAEKGPMGTFNVNYSPVITWFYQLLLKVSKNPIIVALMKCACMLALLAGSLRVIARRINYSAMPLLLVFVSPYFYLYNRSLWDNCFLIPLSVAFVALYLHYVERPRISSAVLLLIGAVAVFYVHLMSVLLLVPGLLCAAWFTRDFIRSRWVVALSGALLVAGACLPYLWPILFQIGPTNDVKASLGASLGAGFFGIKVISFVGLFEYFLPEFMSSGLVLPASVTTVLVAVSALAFAFFALGAMDAGRTLWSRSRTGKLEAEDRLAGLSFAIIAMTVLFYLLFRHPHHPHYINAVWFGYFYFYWRFACKARGRHRYWLWLHGTTVAVLTCTLAVFIHLNGGSRGIHYGATLKNQMEVVEIIVNTSSPDSTIAFEVENYKRFLYAYKTLVGLLKPPLESRPQGVRKKIMVVQYRDQDNPDSGWITVVEIPSLPE